MFFLDTTGKSLQIKLGTTVTTNQLTYVVAWADMTPTTFVPAAAEGVTNNTTPVTVVPAPSASTQRQVKYLSVFNADTVSATVTVQVNDGSARPTIGVTLATGEAMFYDEHNGWQVLTVNGSIKGIGTPGTNGTNGTWNGTNGANGNKWFTGAGAPGGVVSAITAGDLYLNTSTGDIYQASAPGNASWGSPIETLTGGGSPAGSDGQVQLYSSGSFGVGAKPMTVDLTTGYADIQGKLVVGSVMAEPTQTIYVLLPGASGSFLGPNVTFTDNSTVSMHLDVNNSQSRWRSNVAIGLCAGNASDAQLVIDTSGNAVFTGNLSVSGTVSIAGGISSYFGVATAGRGVAPIYAETALAAQTTAGTIATYTPPADGTYRVGGYLTITAIVTDVIQFQVAYTDTNSNAQTLIFFVQGSTTANISATGAFPFPTMDIRAKSGVAIVLKTVLITGVGSITYDAGGTIQQLL